VVEPTDDPARRCAVLRALQAGLVCGHGSNGAYGRARRPLGQPVAGPIDRDVGDITLELGDNLTSAELREEIRETIFEDDLRDIDEDEPRWEELIEVLGKAGIDADEDTLEALPFVIELDDDVARRVTR
jgi:hypothetical protein